MITRVVSRRANNLLRRAALTNGYHSIAGTVTGPSSTSINDLIKTIEIRKQAAANDQSSTLIVALTPGYAKHARDQQLVQSITKRLLRSGEARLTFITAVVDSLPGVESAASEGVAYILQDGDAVIEREALRSTAQRPGSLSFELQHQEQTWRLQLPLSQTIFSTGLTSTLISRQTSQDEEYLENATIRLNAKPALQLSFPLTQLTTYRTVGHSMGNIIRTLNLLEDSSEEPASRNLESAVAAYFKALGIPPEPVNVWALIVPKAILLTGAVRQQARELVLSNEALQDIWTRNKDTNAASNTFQTLLERQARLVKVLSGGGGWGKKAGLLSLDPDLEYSTRELRDDYGWQFDFDAADDTSSSVGRQIDQALGASVEEGDGIVFYIAPKDSIAQAPVNATELLFGVAHKTEDLHESTDRLQFHEGSFGIFSETGLALRIREDGRLASKTKLEVPGLCVGATSS